MCKMCMYHRYVCLHIYCMLLQHVCLTCTMYDICVPLVWLLLLLPAYYYTDGTGEAESLQTIDYILIALVALGLLGGTAYTLRRICRRVRTIPAVVVEFFLWCIFLFNFYYHHNHNNCYNAHIMHIYLPCTVLHCTAGTTPQCVSGRREGGRAHSSEAEGRAAAGWRWRCGRCCRPPPGILQVHIVSFIVINIWS